MPIRALYTIADTLDALVSECDPLALAEIHALAVHLRSIANELKPALEIFDEQVQLARAVACASKVVRLRPALAVVDGGAR